MKIVRVRCHVNFIEKTPRFIEFSPQLIPEPSSFAIGAVALGLMVIGRYRCFEKGF
jgi:hypothetical protein